MLSRFLIRTKCCFLGSFRSSATWHFLLFSPWTQILNVVSKYIFEVLLLFLIYLFAHVFLVLFRSVDYIVVCERTHISTKTTCIFISVFQELQFITYLLLTHNLVFLFNFSKLLHKPIFSSDAFFAEIEFSSRHICLELLIWKAGIL